MFALKLLVGIIAAATSVTALNCGDGRTCVYMKACNGELKEGCPLAYSYKQEGETLIMELAGYQPSGTGRYLAIGFNENPGMSNARVTECSAIGDEKFPSVKLSWNKDEGTANVRIDDEAHFRGQIISAPEGKYENGMIYCSWTQKVGAFNNPKVFQLKAGVKYHHIVAYGETQANPPKLNKHEGAQSTVFGFFDRPNLNCADGRTCVYMNECIGDLNENCPLAYSYLLEGETLSMELAGYQPSGTGRYLAIGFNEENAMANARVTECSAIGDEKIPSVKLSWNKDPGTANVRIEGEPEFRDQIISQPVAKYENGIIYCSWKQKVGTFNNPKVFQVKDGVKYHHLVAYGETDDTKLMKHVGAQKTAFVSFDGSVDQSLNCEDGRTCVYMSSCNGVLNSKCPLAYSFKLDGDILSMELAGYQKSGMKRYLAVGFGEKPGMAESKVTECSAIGDEAFPTVKLSYNTPGDLSVNVRIDNEPAFRDTIISEAVSKYENGMIYCSWKQKVGPNTNEKVFQHKANQKYHHICAYGDTAVDATYAGLDQHDAADTPLYSDFESPNDPGEVRDDVLNCKDGRACVYMKSCKGVFGTKCPLAYSFKLEGDILSMELAGFQQSGKNKYLAVGFGENPGMSESRVTECSAIGDEPFPTVKLSYNTFGDESVNVRIDKEPDFRNSIISDAVSRYEDGMIYCSWKQNVSANANDKVFQHKPNVKYHHICAYGATVSSKDATGLTYHDERDSPLFTDFESPNDPGIVTGNGIKCEDGDGKTCVYMKSCNGAFGTKCPLAYSFKLDGDILSMELAGYQSSGAGKYLAVGFGVNEGMDDSKVTECSAIGDEKYPTVKLSYNNEDGNVRIANEPNFRDTIIKNAFSKYEDGMIYCSWKQNVGPNSNDKVFQRKEGVTYQHICAHGPTLADALNVHDDKDSPIKTDFVGPATSGGDSTGTKLKKAHGSLMMIAWLICVPIAAIFARFLRAHWPTKKPFGLALWFHVHRTFNILACLIVIAGFVCVFIDTKWKWTGVGSSSSYWIKTHSTVGIIACVLAWMQPFISLLRCDPQNPRRPVFNWVHRIIGVTAFLLAVTAVAIAANNFPIWADHLTYLILSFVPLGAVIVLFVIMTILDAKIRVHDSNIVKIHAIRFTLVCIAIAVAAAAAITLVVLLIIA